MGSTCLVSHSIWHKYAQWHIRSQIHATHISHFSGYITNTRQVHGKGRHTPILTCTHTTHNIATHKVHLCIYSVVCAVQGIHTTCQVTCLALPCRWRHQNKLHPPVPAPYGSVFPRVPLLPWNSNTELPTQQRCSNSQQGVHVVSFASYSLHSYQLAWCIMLYMYRI